MFWRSTGCTVVLNYTCCNLKSNKKNNEVIINHTTSTINKTTSTEVLGEKIWLKLQSVFEPASQMCAVQCVQFETCSVILLVLMTAARFFWSHCIDSGNNSLTCDIDVYSDAVALVCSHWWQNLLRLKETDWLNLTQSLTRYIQAASVQLIFLY